MVPLFFVPSTSLKTLTVFAEFDAREARWHLDKMQDFAFFPGLLLTYAVSEPIF
jgi:hypothetical protein